MTKFKIHWIVAAYACGSLLWILITDTLVQRYSRIFPDVIVPLHIFKALFFSIATSWLLYALLDAYQKNREKQNAALRECEARYRSLFMNSLDAILLTSSDGRFFFANPAAQTLFGMTEKELLASGRSDLLDLADPRLPDLLRSQEETGKARGEVRFRRKDGDLFEAEISSYRFEDDHNNPRFCLVIRDVSARRKTEEELRKEMVRRRVLMNISNEGIAIFNQDHRVVEANPKFARMLGYTPEEVTSLHTWDFEANHTEQEIRSLFSDVSQVNMSLETRHRRKDGSVYDVAVSASGAHIGDEQRVITINRDITDRKRTEEFVRQSEARFRNLFDNVASVAVQGYDRERNVIYWNRASESLYGYAATEALGKKLEALIIPPAMRQAVVEAIRGWIEEGVPIPAGELRLCRKDGSEVPVFSSHVLQRTSLGEYELFCLDIDLTEIEAIKKELIASKDAAVSANRAKSEFLANMSHEIRTPLNGIYGMLQLLASMSSDAEQQECVKAALKSSKRLTRLLSDILDLSKIEANRLDICKSRFHFPELIQSLKDIFVLSAREKSLSIGFYIENEIPDLLVGDEVRVRQILFNLIGNALKFTETGGVAVKASLLPRAADGTVRVLFSIKDTGIGIPSDKIRSIFEPFVQANDSYLREQQGAGLGLTIVKRVTEMLGGILCVDSKYGSGTTFSVSLPFDPWEKPSVGDAGAFSGQTESARPRQHILLVEDDELNRDVAQRMLQKFGWDVTVARDGKEALERVFETGFDCILMDVQMPVMDGVVATRIIRDAASLGEKRHTPIVAMTAYAMTGDREKFLAAGMNDYISKPFDGERLREVVNKAVARRSRPR